MRRLFTNLGLALLIGLATSSRPALAGEDAHPAKEPPKPEAAPAQPAPRTEEAAKPSEPLAHGLGEGAPPSKPVPGEHQEPAPANGTNPPAHSGSSALKGGVDPHSEAEKLRQEVKSIIPRVPGKGNESELDRYQRLLELARELRARKELDAADQHLWELVEPPAPPDIQRAAMLELAGVAVDTGKYSKAQTIYSEMARKFPKDPMLPQVLLIQGRLYRDMGMPELAVTKFFSVTSVALSLNLDRLEYYRSIVLRAQSEIADTYYLQGKYTEAIGYFKKLLTLDNIDGERPQFLFKMLKSYVGMGNPAEAIATGQLFVNSFTNSVEVPEVRYLIAQACRKLNRKEDAMRQVFTLLESQEALIAKYPADFAYWQQRTGNEVANQLYNEGDYLNALVVYSQMANVNGNIEWRLPVLYQIGLVYEHLKQPAKASETYTQIMSHSEEIRTNTPTPSLTALIDMAKFRRDFLGWQTNVDTSARKLSTPMTTAKESPPPQPATPN